MSDQKVESMLHVVLQKQDKLQQGQANLTRLMAEVLDILGTVVPLDVTGEGSPPPPPPVDPELLAGADSEERARALANLRAIRERSTAA